MKVAVDIDVLVNDRRTGVYYYDLKLLQALLAGNERDEFELAYFGEPRSLEQLELPAKSAKVRANGWFPRKVFNLSLRTPFGLPFDVLTGARADIYVFTKFVRWPLWRGGKSVVFVYDTSFVDYPELVETWHFRKYLTWAVPRSIKRADHVVAISESTKASLVKHYGAPAEKISVVTPALDHEHFRPAAAAEVARVKQKFGIEKSYVLSVGTIEPRKNLVGLLRAYAKLPAEVAAEHTLVLAGGKGWLDDEINQLYDELSQRMTIIRTGYVDDADLPALYSGASVFVYPSLFEGFGIPPLEAMACGAPVIASNNSSLPEVVGDAGVMVDAQNADQLAREIEGVLGDPKRAAELKARGLERAKRFRWEASAEELKKIIDNVGAKA